MAAHFQQKTASASRGRTFVLDKFCLRQFESKIDYQPQDFESKVNELASLKDLVDGYAPFCKHVFVPNFAGLLLNTLKITPQNKHLLRSEYEARTEKELPVLVRHFPAEAVTAPPAKLLDIILYSRDQIIKENAATGSAVDLAETAPWGIISVKPQDVRHELPMQPITMMRNTMISEGGSGVELDRAKYAESVAFWQEHAVIK